MTVNADQAKLAFEVGKCRTMGRGSVNLLDCLAENQYLICGYALLFGYGYFCMHSQRKEFAERLPENKSLNPSQTEKLE